MALPTLPNLQVLPGLLPMDNAVCIGIEEGVPILRASQTVQDRIEVLLVKQRESGLSEDDETELDGYEEIDDYLSFVNRTIRNLSVSHAQKAS